MSGSIRSRLLTVVMLLMGILLVTGSTISVFANNIFPFDKEFFGTDASVAGVVFGIGIAVASFDPEAHLSWVRTAILYAILVFIYEIVFGIFWGTGPQISALVVAAVFGIAVAILYPNSGDLLPHPGTMASAKGVRG
jgi:peptidoglycan/LPS O-acetylase OafA/YrhL